MPRDVIRLLSSLLVAIALAASGSSVADAQSPPAAAGARGVVDRGDAVVTGFAGTVAPGPDLPADVHPLDRTMIDLEGVTARVFDLSQLGGGPEGQLTDAPVKRVLKARDIGHVFGIAFDGDGTGGPPNLYLSATSVFGLQMVAPGASGGLERVLTGRPGARWMKGQFGDARGGGPGSIWKVDGRTGEVGLFADIRTGDKENSGASLGALAFDPRSRHLYVSDLETGLIWRLDLSGRIVDIWDHGTQGRAAAGLPFAAYDPATRTDRRDETFNTEIPETWGMAQPERRVWGLAVEAGRLYYAVAAGPSIWSVGLNADGTFGGDARLEIEVKGTTGSQVSSILFDGPGIMYVAQRGAQLGSYDYHTFMRPQEAETLRYRFDEASRRWLAVPGEYAVGMPPEYHGAVGGVALDYGYDRLGRIDYGRCRQTLWVTGEHLRSGTDQARVERGGPRNVKGLQGNYKSLLRPANVPPYQAWYVDYDATYTDDDQFGRIGNVAIYGPCAGTVTYSAENVQIPVWTKGPNLVIEKRCEPAALGAKVRCAITLRNSGDAAADGPIDIVDETRVLWGPAAGTIVATQSSTPDSAAWTCETTPAGAVHCRVDGAALAPGVSRELVVTVDTRELVTGGSLGFRNCATLDHATAHSRACAKGGTGITVTKTGPAACVPGEDCKFTVTISNASALPFKGDVLLADTLIADGAPIAARISEIEPPLACKDGPQKLPFSCLASLSLAPGESRVHSVVVEMPPPGKAWAQNCFVAADPWLAAAPEVLAGLLARAKLGDKDAPGGHPACTWVKLDNPKKYSSPAAEATIATLLPPIAVCEDGRQPSSSGRCPCPQNAPFDEATGTCRWQAVCWDKVRLRPDGVCCPFGAVWWPQTQSCRAPPVTGCSDVWRRMPSGACCPKDGAWADGACRPRRAADACGADFISELSGGCVPLPVRLPIVALPGCADGRARLVNGRCPTAACPLNAAFNPRTGRCLPAIVQGGCGAGFIRLPHSGRCVAAAFKPRPCLGVLVQNAAGHCVPPGLVNRGECADGQRRIGGACLGARSASARVVSPGVCPGGLVRGASGGCLPPSLLRRDGERKTDARQPVVVVPPVIRVDPVRRQSTVKSVPKAEHTRRRVPTVERRVERKSNTRPAHKTPVKARSKGHAKKRTN